ncbi:helix-turn-helix transcriptional regulator [Streptomyces sp. NBC_00299]|nr:helix-turn-helix transcriptional regulator [Streptomyces sp. NBC_00299]
MTDFDAIDALLAGAKKEVPLPPAEERRALREELSVSRAQLAQALNVSPSTVGGWETGRDPSGEVREKYAYFLEGARTKLAADAVEDDGPDEEPVLAEEALPGEEAGVDAGTAEAEQRTAPDEADDVEALTEPRPCVLCGQLAGHQVAGFPQHLDPAECGAAGPVQPAEPARAESPAPRVESRESASVGRQSQRPVESRSCPSVAG